MKCDILIHAPTGIAYTGIPEEDQFIGMPGVLLKAGSQERRKDVAVTLGLDDLLMTWKDGKEFRTEKVSYQAISGLEMGERRQSEVVSIESAAGAALTGLAFGALSLAEQALTHVKTLKVKTEAMEYEIWVADAATWADRLKRTQRMNPPTA